MSVDDQTNEERKLRTRIVELEEALKLATASAPDIWDAAVREQQKRRSLEHTVNVLQQDKLKLAKEVEDYREDDLVAVGVLQQISGLGDVDVVYLADAATESVTRLNTRVAALEERVAFAEQARDNALAMQTEAQTKAKLAGQSAARRINALMALVHEYARQHPMHDAVVEQQVNKRIKEIIE